MSSEQQLEFVPVQPTAEDVTKLLSVLMAFGWMTRKQLASHLGWSERAIRAVAEAAGDDIVRGPKGFVNFDRATLEEIQHAASIAESQGNKMVDYALKLRRRAHARVG